jgi:branched-subunit amino acid ABC-type transport system permease component
MAKVVMLVAAVLLSALLALVPQSHEGRQGHAGDRPEPEAARIVGINVTRIHCAAFGVGTAAAVAPEGCSA